MQAFAGEAFGEQGQVVHDRGPAGELVVGGGQELLVGLGVEGAGELLGQADGRGSESDLLVLTETGYGKRVALTELLAHCRDFEVDESGIVWAGGSYVRRPLSVPFRVTA